MLNKIFIIFQIKYFKEKGFNLVTIWEHNFNEMKRDSDPQFKSYYTQRNEYYSRLETVGHLNIRDAFFGGRTNNLFFTYECKDGEKIRYLDVTSLYPSVLVKNPYPLRHPIVLNEFNSTDISSYFGFVKCKILPPQNLYLPVLPLRKANKKLLFPLCKTCAERKSDSKYLNSNCNHSEEKREMVGDMVQ